MEGGGRPALCVHYHSYTTQREILNTPYFLERRQGELLRIHLLHTRVNKLSWLDCRSTRFLILDKLFREMLSTLSRVLGAVGWVTGQSSAVRGDKGIDDVLQLPYAR